jgi:hypothetical protein
MHRFLSGLSLCNTSTTPSVPVRRAKFANILAQGEILLAKISTRKLICMDGKTARSLHAAPISRSFLCPAFFLPCARSFLPLPARKLISPSILLSRPDFFPKLEI